MGDDIRRILEFLEPFRTGTREDISPFLNEFFPVKDGLQQYEELQENGVIMHFLEDLNKYADFNTQYQRTKAHGFIGIRAYLKDEGRLALKKERERILQEKAHQSSIDVSQSIIDTNKSVIKTNEAMIENGRIQSEINQQIASNSDKQVDIMDKQRILVDKQNGLYRFTLYLTGANILTAIVLCVATINSNADKQLISIQRSQLADKNKEIKQLQFLKSDSVHYVLHYPKSKSKTK